MFEDVTSMFLDLFDGFHNPLQQHNQEQCYDQ